MSTYRHRDPAVRAEMRRILRARPYGHEARRRERARADALEHQTRMRRHVAALITLTALALVIIGWDYEARARGVDLKRPAETTQGHTTDVTTTLPPHPATSPSRP